MDWGMGNEEWGLRSGVCGVGNMGWRKRLVYPHGACATSSSSLEGESGGGLVVNCYIVLVPDD